MGTFFFGGSVGDVLLLEICCTKGMVCKSRKKIYFSSEHYSDYKRQNVCDKRVIAHHGSRKADAQKKNVPSLISSFSHKLLILTLAMRNCTYLEKTRRTGNICFDYSKRSRVLSLKHNWTLWSNNFAWIIYTRRRFESRQTRLYVLQLDKYKHKEYNKYNINHKRKT